MERLLQEDWLLTSSNSFVLGKGYASGQASIGIVHLAVTTNMRGHLSYFNSGEL
ncbi:MAG: hypothetical protein ACI9FB_001810 [Candidatus Azotimanducaceae bacterium]|jgi:hypothetical protein